MSRFVRGIFAQLAQGPHPNEMEGLSKSSIKAAFARSGAGASPTVDQKGADGPWGRLDI